MSETKLTKPYPSPETMGQSTWNRRYRLFQAMLHDGPEERTYIVQCLEYLKQHKDLSFGERKMLDMAQGYDAWIAEQKKKIVDLAEYRTKRTAS